MPLITQAFVLGAGLGTRLRPLTEELPKPLVPIFQKPLVTFALDHLIANGVERFSINTHHQPHCFDQVFGNEQPGGRSLNTYRGFPLKLHHEPVLLETAGGIWNAREALGDAPFYIYNGDVLTDLPLQPLLEEHFRRANLVTLALRSDKEPKHVAFDERTGRVIDIRNQLGTGARESYLFTGLYIVNPEFINLIPAGEKCSVIPIFLRMLREGAKLGGIVIDEGHWWDVGTPRAYLDLHRELLTLDFPAFPIPERDWRGTVHPEAHVDPSATLLGCSVIGAGGRVETEAFLEDTIIWPGAQIASRSRLRDCIVRTRKRAEGDRSDAVI